VLIKKLSHYLHEQQSRRISNNLLTSVNIFQSSCPQIDPFLPRVVRDAMLAQYLL